MSASETRPYTRSGGGFGVPRESREIAFDKGKKAINGMMDRLRLSPHIIESACRLYQLALSKNFVQGRKTINVAAACVYIVCRREKTPHMLIDFSDALSVGVRARARCSPARSHHCRHRAPHTKQVHQPRTM